MSLKLLSLMNESLDMQVLFHTKYRTRIMQSSRGSLESIVVLRKLFSLKSYTGGIEVVILLKPRA